MRAKLEDFSDEQHTSKSDKYHAYSKARKDEASDFSDVPTMREKLQAGNLKREHTAHVDYGYEEVEYHKRNRNKKGHKSNWTAEEVDY